MAEFATVANIADIPSGTARAFTVNGKFIAVANCNGEYFAVDNVCSHAYAELAEGEVDDDDCTIECPRHGSIFSLASGRPRTLPAVTPVGTYAVQVVGDHIQVAV